MNWISIDILNIWSWNFVVTEISMDLSVKSWWVRMAIYFHNNTLLIMSLIHTLYPFTHPWCTTRDKLSTPLPVECRVYLKQWFSEFFTRKIFQELDLPQHQLVFGDFFLLAPYFVFDSIRRYISYSSYVTIASVVWKFSPVPYEAIHTLRNAKGESWF